jgi:hypothetical protein
LADRERSVYKKSKQPPDYKTSTLFSDLMVDPLYEQRFIEPTVGNSVEEKSCLNMPVYLTNIL